MKTLKSFILLTVVSIGLIWLTATAWEAYRFWTSPISTTQKQAPVVVEIAEKQSVQSWINQLAKQGLMPHPKWFAWLMRYEGLDKSLRVGEYRIDPRWTPSELIEHLKNDPPVQYHYTLIPGTTFKEMWQAVRTLPNLVKTHDLTPERLKEALAIKTSLEGQFLPETYAYQKWGDSDVKLFRRMHQAMRKTLQEAWESRDKTIPLKTPYQALILASIVEKETGVAAERPMIAGVFMNRLRKKMRLQSDPTVIYGMGEAYDGNIRKRDLREKTVYNTYRINGLPPTPICMPSKASIEAVCHPAKTSALYFVGTGAGKHVFSDTLKAHNRAVRRYQLK